MELRRKFNKSSAAAVNYIQVSHRRDAVEYTIAGIKKIHELNLELLGRDLLTLEMEGTMQAWVPRFFSKVPICVNITCGRRTAKLTFPRWRYEMAALSNWNPDPHRSHPRYISFVFSGSADGNFDAIERMRRRVNVMKHDAGLELEHFITEADYTAAIEALEGFWNHLATAERIVS